MPVAVRSKFKVGEKVMAKWPGSNRYFPGTVKDLNDIEYLVAFEDEDTSELAVKYKDVTTPFVVTKRTTRSSSRGRSPSRKSPSRKSPTSKSPSRKSPGRPRSPHRSLKQNNVNNDANSSAEEKLSVRSRSTKIETSTPIRQSARLAEKVTVSETKINHTKFSSLTDRKPSTKPGFVRNAMTCCCNISQSILPTFLTLPFFAFLVAGPFMLNQMCTKKKCSITQMPTLPHDLKHYLDIDAALLLVGFLAVQILLSFLPLGEVQKLPNGKTVRMNSFYVLIINFLSIPICFHFKVNLLIVYTLYRQLLVSYVLLALFLSLAFYIRAGFTSKSSLNPKGNTGNILIDFMEGRELNPSVGPINVKLQALRCFTMSMVLLNSIIIIKDYENNNGVYSKTLIMLAVFQIIYAIDYIWFESTYLTTYEYHGQGVGFLLIGSYLTTPFYFLVYTRYVLNHRNELPWQYLVGIGIVYVIGYALYRGSNSQKHTFRTNPNHPSVAHLESLPTATGKRLLASGYWGIVRHPNYLGDILIQISLGLLCGFTHGLPWVLVSITSLFLTYRVFMVESTCKAKYRHSWDNYCSRVRYRLIPGIF